MIFQLTALCLLAAAAQAHVAVSHVSRHDNYHGYHGHDLGHSLGYGGYGHNHGGHNLGYGGYGHSHGGHNLGYGGYGHNHGGHNLGYGHRVEYHGYNGHHGHHGYENLKHHEYQLEHHAYPEYKYEYSVKDLHTGDIKSAHESRHGDHVVGAYQLVQPDGNLRKVHYVADDHNGFNAAVHYETVHHRPHHYHHY